jgi:Zn-dependent protease with chaperone function
METARFEQMVARLEAESARAPALYQLKVALLALLGFAVLLLILGTTGLGLVALLGGLVLAVVLTGGKAFLLLLKFGGKLVLLLAAPLWVLLKSSGRALLMRLPPPEGRELQRTEAPALFAALDDMRRRMRGPKFHHVLLVHEMNAAVVQRPLFGLIGWPRNYLLLGLPLLESLAPDEALAVVAHEYGHLAGSHSHFAAFIYRLRLSWGTIQELSSQWQGAVGRWLQKLVGWYAPYFNAYTFVLARANEYQADRASAELVGAAVAAQALKRVNVSGPAYERFLEDACSDVQASPTPPQDVADRWAKQANAMHPEAAAWLKQALGRDSSVSDTHPALRQRLAALQGAPDEGDGAQQAVPTPLAGPSAADVWLGAGAGALREALQREWRERVAPGWGERHSELQRLRQELDALEALAEPDADQQATRLRLRLQLEPKGDHLPALVDFNAQHPGHALGLFLEGSLRLERADETGLALLEQAIQADADATRPVCEKAFAFLKPRNDPRADDYQRRWHERQQWEAARQAQLDNLSPSHEVRAPDDLAPEARRHAETVLQAQGDGVAHAWLVRRVLPADPGLPTYVLCLELTWWARLRRKQGEIVSRFARQEWQMHLFICSLANRYKALGPKVRALPGTRLR